MMTGVQCHKLRIYAERGVTHVWLVDPDQRTLGVLRRERSHWLIIGGARTKRACARSLSRVASDPEAEVLFRGTIRGAKVEGVP